MATVRCYVPVSPVQLAQLLQERQLPGTLTAYSVTPEVRTGNPAGDTEEWEYAALQDAAADRVASAAPVIVAAVDIGSDRVDDSAAQGSRVSVTGIDLPRVAALHLGDDVVSGDATNVPDASTEIELSWYDTTELAHVLELAAAAYPDQT